MAETVSDGERERQESQLGDAVLDSLRVCLRCDWTGETDGETCPRCEASLYRLPESTKLLGVTSIPRPQPHSAGGPIPSSPVEVPQEDDNIPPAVAVADNRRWWVIVGAFTVAALWIVATGGPFDRLQAPTAPGHALALATTPVNEPPRANSAKNPTPTDGVLRHGNEVLTPEGPNLVAVDPDTGESRTLLDRAVSTDPLPIAAGGEIPREITNAAWSSDGRWVAFDGPDAALWVMNAEMEIRRLANTVYGGWVWSPTEAQLAMILNSTLTVVDALTGRKIDVGEVVGDVTSAPVWSPDGTRILFGARGGSLYSVDVQSGKRSLLVRLPGENLDSMDQIEWSPDGAHLVIVNDLDPGGGRLYVMNADGSGVRVLLDNFEPGGLAWSPDGESIAYATYGAGGDDGADRLWTISRVEGLPFTLAASTYIGDPVWSPDGSRIAFVGSTSDGPGWFAVDADGAGPRLEIDELTYVSWRGGPVFPSH